MTICFLIQDELTRRGSPGNYFYGFEPRTTMIYIDDPEPEPEGVDMGELEDFTNF